MSSIILVIKQYILVNTICKLRPRPAWHKLCLNQKAGGMCLLDYISPFNCYFYINKHYICSYIYIYIKNPLWFKNDSRKKYTQDKKNITVQTSWHLVESSVLFCIEDELAIYPIVLYYLKILNMELFFFFININTFSFHMIFKRVSYISCKEK